ncbi:barstar family protein [Nocardia jiangxiensis]|uniref:Barstar family protein n=1 Tax=Nocardia jiangxiensis TaxID=282685 RepID=A0ABW6RZG9_9NOCA|nr:barstar family protein [Nocardia jiangxiensis]
MGEATTLAHFLTGTDPDASTASVLGSLTVDAGGFSGVRFRAPEGFVVRELRGSKMRTLSGVFDEFAAAFQFPYYFGQNKDAFDECLRDLDEFVGPAPGYVAVVRDSAQLLAERSAEREWFVSAMTDCAQYWSAHEGLFRVVLQAAPEGLPVVTLSM